MRATIRILLTVIAAVVLTGPSAAASPLEIVTTLPAYASIARFVGGERVKVGSISRGDEDAHFVKPKPSFALMLREADLFVTTGLDLELWAPTLVDKSGNRRIRDGQAGFVSASQEVPLLEVPESFSREGGDIHIYGNPHIFTSPLNAKLIAANIAAGLQRIDPDGASHYEANLRSFQRRMDEAVYGAELSELLDSAILDPLLRQGKLMPFLRSQEYRGRKLIELLGGWLAEGMAFRDQAIVAYHKNWIYFAELFGLQVLDYVERKPGIPPSARHVHRLIEEIKGQQIRALLAANYFSAQQVDSIAQRTGCAAIRVPLGPGGEGPGDYFELVDRWVGELAKVFAP
jgi:zinc/manganese transport system substrate-binding protein